MNPIDNVLTAVDVKVGVGIDKITFKYKDKEVVYGSDGSGHLHSGSVILTDSEFLVTVKHEQFPHNAKSQGSALEFISSKGRIWKFNTETTTELKSEIKVLHVANGFALSGLCIDNGVLKELIQRKCTEKECITANCTDNWYVIVTGGLKDDDYLLQHFESWSTAKESWRHANEFTNKKGRGAILIDVVNNRVEKSGGTNDVLPALLDFARKSGCYVVEETKSATLQQILKTLYRLMNNQSLFMLLLISLLLAISSWFHLQSQMMAGHILTISTLSSESQKAIETLKTNMFVKYLITDCKNATPKDIQTVCIVIFVIFSIASKLFDTLNIFFHHHESEQTRFALDMKVFKHVFSLDQSFFESRGEASIRSAMDVRALSDTISWNIPYTMVLSFKFILGSSFLYSISPFLTTTMLILYALSKLCLRGIEDKERRVHKLHHKRSDSKALIFSESLSNFSLIKNMAKEAFQAEKYSKRIADRLTILSDQVSLRCYREFSSGCSHYVIFGFCVYYHCIQHDDDSHSTLLMSASDMTSFFLIFCDLQGLLRRIEWHFGKLQQDQPAIDRFLDLLQTKGTMEMRNNGTKCEITNAKIEFKDVWFAYPSRPNEYILKGLSLSMTANAVTAIVGSSGNGKSTITKLISRVYDPNSGSITLNGIDLKEYDIKHLREIIGIVSQSPKLFPQSIAANIAFGVVDSHLECITQEQIEDAANLAGCHEFISKLPNKYNTFAGGCGDELSGGQKQRISIARAIIRKPKILVLDEATSSLDAINEAKVQKSLEKCMVGRTTVVVAHRLSTIKNADKIIVVEGGLVVETGTHKHLLKQRGAYFRLVSKQSSIRINDDEDIHEDEKSKRLQQVITKLKQSKKLKQVMNKMKQMKRRGEEECIECIGSSVGEIERKKSGVPSTFRSIDYNTTMEAFSKTSKKAGIKALKDLPELVNAASAFSAQLEKTHEQVHVEAVKAAKKTSVDGSANDMLSKLLVTVQGQLVVTISHLELIMRWIKLNIPTMEDGGNFGADVQGAALKAVVEAHKVLDTHLASLPDYHKDRFAALKDSRKVTQSKVTKTSQSTTSTTGGKAEDAGDKTVKSKSVDTTDTEAAIFEDAFAFVVATDTKWFYKLRSIAVVNLDTLAFVCDVVNKNIQKIKNPRGTGSRGGGQYTY